MQQIRTYESGVLTSERQGAQRPPEELWRSKKNGLVLIECPQRIPCNPCATSCPTGAILPFLDINDHPTVDYEKCSGCAICVAKCPGLACFVIDRSYSAKESLMKLPHEMLPLPEVGEVVDCLGKMGEFVCKGKIMSVSEPLKDRTRVLHVAVANTAIDDVRSARRCRDE